MNTFEEGEIKEALPNDTESIASWSGTFSWKCRDPFVSKLRKAKHSQAFESKIFEIGQIQWFLRLYPNGSGKKNQQFVNLFLYLCALPPTLSKLRVKYTISCEETNTHWQHIKSFQHDAMGSGWSNHRLSREKLFTFSSFTFKVNVAILEKFDQNGKLVAIPPLAANAKIINGGGAAKLHRHSHAHRHYVGSHHSDGHSPQIAAPMLKPVNMSPHIHRNVSNQAALTEIQQIQSSIQSLSNQVQELQIVVSNMQVSMQNDANHNHQVLQMLQSIKQDLNRSKQDQSLQHEEDTKHALEEEERENSGHDDGDISVEKWLQNIEYSQYYQLFQKRGYVDIALIQQMSKDEFDTLEFQKSEDQTRIWIAIQSLKSFM